jgi:hypothetical protein
MKQGGIAKKQQFTSSCEALSSSARFVHVPTQIADSSRRASVRGAATGMRNRITFRFDYGSRVRDAGVEGNGEGDRVCTSGFRSLSSPYTPLPQMYKRDSGHVTRNVSRSSIYAVRAGNHN